MKSLKATCTEIGLEYENVAITYEVSNNGSTVVARDLPIPDCGIEMDFVVDVPLVDSKGRHVKTLRKYAQAKGGKPGKRKKPGAQRTDSVKKAIADGILLKTVNPDHWYTVYFSERPKNGSASEKMIQSAIDFGIIDEIFYVNYQGALS
jgi:hypothetical protein